MFGILLGNTDTGNGGCIVPAEDTTVVAVEDEVMGTE